jgi:hypothetical protein
MLRCVGAQPLQVRSVAEFVSRQLPALLASGRKNRHNGMLGRTLPSSKWSKEIMWDQANQAIRHSVDGARSKNASRPGSGSLPSLLNLPMQVRRTARLHDEGLMQPFPAECTRISTLAKYSAGAGQLAGRWSIITSSPCARLYLESQSSEPGLSIIKSAIMKADPQRRSHATELSDIVLPAALSTDLS